MKIKFGVQKRPTAKPKVGDKVISTGKLRGPRPCARCSRVGCVTAKNKLVLQKGVVGVIKEVRKGDQPFLITKWQAKDEKEDGADWADVCYNASGPEGEGIGAWRRRVMQARRSAEGVVVRQEEVYWIRNNTNEEHDLEIRLEDPTKRNDWYYPDEIKLVRKPVEHPPRIFLEGVEEKYCADNADVYKCIETAGKQKRSWVEPEVPKQKKEEGLTALTGEWHCTQGYGLRINSNNRLAFTDNGSQYRYHSSFKGGEQITEDSKGVLHIGEYSSEAGYWQDLTTNKPATEEQIEQMNAANSDKRMLMAVSLKWVPAKWGRDKVTWYKWSQNGPAAHYKTNMVWERRPEPPPFKADAGHTVLTLKLIKGHWVSAEDGSILNHQPTSTRRDTSHLRDGTRAVREEREVGSRGIKMIAKATWVAEPTFNELKIVNLASIRENNRGIVPPPKLKQDATPKPQEARTDLRRERHQFRRRQRDLRNMQDQRRAEEMRRMEGAPAEAREAFRRQQHDLRLAERNRQREELRQMERRVRDRRVEMTTSADHRALEKKKVKKGVRLVARPKMRQRLQDPKELRRVEQDLSHSVTALQNALKARAQGSHVPSRNAKLTHYLQDSLSSKNSVSLVLHASMRNEDADDTLRLARFATQGCGRQGKCPKECCCHWWWN